MLDPGHPAVPPLSAPVEYPDRIIVPLWNGMWDNSNESVYSLIVKTQGCAEDIGP